MLYNLKLLRKERGISQQRLADVLKVSQQSINQYENHNIEPDISILIKMADYFDTSVDFIIGRTGVRRQIEPTTEHSLNEAEAELITSYRSLRPLERACIHTVIQTLSDK